VYSSPFRKYLVFSLGAHVAVFLISLVVPALFGRPYKFSQDKVVWVNVPKGTSNTLGSPLKKSAGLPQSTIEEQKNALKAAPSGQPKKPLMSYTPPNQKPEKKPQNIPQRIGLPASKVDSALARMQKMVAMKKKVEQEAAQVPDTQPGGFTFGSGTGPYVSPDDPEYVMYQLKIRQKIMDQWILPMKYTEQASGLICRIIVHINDRGEVIATEWDQKSGDPSFDLSAQRAVQKAAPLDLPPERLKYEVFNEGFIVEFKPTQVTQTVP